MHLKNKIVQQPGNVLYLQSIYFDIEMTFCLTDNSGIEDIYLPNPATTPPDKKITVIMVGNNVVRLHPFASETLDGVTVPGSGYWTVTKPNYLGNNFQPAQKLILKTDGINYYTINT